MSAVLSAHRSKENSRERSAATAPPVPTRSEHTCFAHTLSPPITAQQHVHTRIHMHRRMQVPCTARQCLGTATGLGESARAMLRKMRPHTARTWPGQHLLYSAVCAEGRPAQVPSPFLSPAERAAHLPSHGATLEGPQQHHTGRRTLCKVSNTTHTATTTLTIARINQRPF